MSGDEIKGKVGDDSKHAAIGKDIEQRSNVVHNYINPTEKEQRAQDTDSYGRLKAVEETLDLVADFVMGNKRRDIHGLIEWRENTDLRIEKLEDDRRIVIPPQTAILLIVIGVLTLLLVFVIVSWLSGTTARVPGIIPSAQIASSIIAFLLEKYAWTR